MGGVKSRAGHGFVGVNWVAEKPLSFGVVVFVAWDLGWPSLSVWVGCVISSRFFNVELPMLAGYRPGFYSMDWAA